ncbi:hypothetical protein ACQPYK_22450 [Streptosporangium sp. CA-135522]|uniref:hypothetical protein n=1 Tax=Streptosporangium sp. CA-135522 TaxID=3240072 RepID=UPI003D911A14
MTVTIRDLTKRYGSATVLDRLDLEIGAGVTGLLGPNGYLLLLVEPIEVMA